MATARKTANVGSSGKIEIIITSGTQSTSNNTTQVRVRGIMHNSAGRSYDNSADGVERKITGTNSWSGTFNFDLSSNESYTFIDRTFTVTHNSDGTKTVNYTITLGKTLTGTFGNGGSVGTSLTLPAIDRKPGAPGTPSISPVSPGVVDASWTAAASNGSSIDEYQILYSRYSDFRSFDQLRDSTARTRRISGLSTRVTYYFKVRAHNAQGWGPYSSTRSYTTPDHPTAPGAPSLSHSSGTTISASWAAADAQGRTITNYQLQVDDNSSFSSPSSVNKGTTRSHTITGATMGKTWYVRVRAQNDQGWGPWSPVRSLAVPNVPDPVGTLTLNYVPPDILEVSWSAPNNNGAAITEYDLEYSRSSSFSNSTTVSTTSRSVTLEDLNIGDTYYVRVRAKNKQGAGPWSSSSDKQIVSGPRIRHSGVWKNSIVWVKYNDVWRIATPFVKSGGVWRLGGG